MCLCLTELFQIELFFDIKTVFTLNWIVTYNGLYSLKWKCFWQLNCVLMLNWIVLNREQIIYIKMDLALNNLRRLICHKTQQVKPSNMNQKYQEEVKSACFRCLPFSWKYCLMPRARLFINRAHSSWVIRWWGTRCLRIFTSAWSFKVLDHLENLTLLWKSFENKLPSVSCLDIFESLIFYMFLHKRSLAHSY